MKISYTAIFCIISLFMLCSSCKKESYHYPSVTTDLVVLETNSEGEVSKIVVDNGTEYTPYNKVSGAKADSLYRAKCTYLPVSTANDESYDAAKIYSTALILSPLPVSTNHFPNGIKTDPVNVASVWCSGGYVNFHLYVMAKDKSHAFHFVQTQFEKSTDNRKTVKFTLYHDRGEDIEAFTREVFLSCPLSQYTLQKGDSIFFSIQTYDGLKSYPFIY